MAIHYNKVLNPQQCEEMHKFLILLKTCYKKANQLEIKPDIEKYMKEYRGYKTTEQNRKANRESVRKRRERMKNNV
jgi:hypothetical protein